MIASAEYIHSQTSMIGSDFMYQKGTPPKQSNHSNHQKVAALGGIIPWWYEVIDTGISCVLLLLFFGPALQSGSWLQLLIKLISLPMFFLRWLLWTNKKRETRQEQFWIKKVAKLYPDLKMASSTRSTALPSSIHVCADFFQSIQSKVQRLSSVGAYRFIQVKRVKRIKMIASGHRRKLFEVDAVVVDYTLNEHGQIVVGSKQPSSVHDVIALRKIVKQGELSWVVVDLHKKKQTSRWFEYMISQ